VIPVETEIEKIEMLCKKHRILDRLFNRHSIKFFIAVLMEQPIEGKRLLSKVLGEGKERHTRYLDYVNSSKLIKSSKGKIGRSRVYSINMNLFSEILGDFWAVKFSKHNELPDGKFSERIDKLPLPERLKRIEKELWGNVEFRKRMTNMYELSDVKNLKNLYGKTLSLVFYYKNLSEVLDELDNPLNWYKYFYRTLYVPIGFSLYVFLKEMKWLKEDSIDASFEEIFKKIKPEEIKDFESLGGMVFIRRNIPNDMKKYL